MFGYVVDELSKLADSISYLKTTTSTSNTNSTNTTTTNSTNTNTNNHTTYPVDLNNNNLFAIQSSKHSHNKKAIRNQTATNKKNKQLNVSFQVKHPQPSLIEEYDWFNVDTAAQKSLIEANFIKKNSLLYSKENEDCISLTSSFESYYEDLNREFRFDNLNKFYSPNTNFKQRCFKMLTSYDKDEFLYTYLDNDADTELVESLKSNTLKAVKVFQKPYYQESIKGELIRVPSWRMKEKVNCWNFLSYKIS